MSGKKAQKHGLAGGKSKGTISAPNNDDFVARSVRHLAEMRRINPASDGKGQKFPDGWFDIPERQLADLGAMFFLASLAAFHRPRSIAQVFGYLETPLRLGQYQIYRSNGYPRAFITWAGLDVAAERQFAVDHIPLRPEQWNSGTSKWVVDLASPFGHIGQIVGMLSKSEQANRVRTLWHNKPGTRARVMEWSRKDRNSPIEVASYGRAQFQKILDGA